MDVVAAPRDVDAPDISRTEPEPGFAGVQHGGRLETGTAAASFADVRSDGERQPLRRALRAPVAGEVQQLGRSRRYGQARRDRGERVRLVAEVGDTRSSTYQTTRQELDLEPESELCAVVVGCHHDRTGAALVGIVELFAVDRHRVRTPPGRPVTAVALSLDTGPSEEADAGLGEDGHPYRHVHPAVRARRLDRQHGRRDVSGGLGQRRPPVHDLGQCVLAQHHPQCDALCTERDHPLAHSPGLLPTQPN